MKVAAVKAAARDADRYERPQRRRSPPSNKNSMPLLCARARLSGVLEWSLLRR